MAEPGFQKDRALQQLVGSTDPDTIVRGFCQACRPCYDRRLIQDLLPLAMAGWETEALCLQAPLVGAVRDKLVQCAIQHEQLMVDRLRPLSRVAYDWSCTRRYTVEQHTLSLSLWLDLLPFLRPAHSRAKNRYDTADQQVVEATQAFDGLLGQLSTTKDNLTSLKAAADTRATE
jgi:hypothetical protein